MNQEKEEKITVKNNHVELIGNICGGIRVLKEADPEKKIYDKIEVIFIPNDVWDARGKPNSLRVHMYGDKTKDFREQVENGDRVKLIAHLRRVSIMPSNPEDKPKYSTEIVIDDFEVLRKGSTGYYKSKKEGVAEAVQA